jgi:hypothetical protein
LQSYRCNRTRESFCGGGLDRSRLAGLRCLSCGKQGNGRQRATDWRVSSRHGRCKSKRQQSKTGSLWGSVCRLLTALHCIVSDFRQMPSGLKLKSICFFMEVAELVQRCGLYCSRIPGIWTGRIVDLVWLLIWHVLPGYKQG